MKMDRISLLPNSILCDILSYLPTKEAVSTSILSSRWRHVWKELQVLDIDDTTSRPGLGWEARFASYVNAILARRNADYPIQKFRLTCYEYSERSLTILTWLDAVNGPYLQELYLCLEVACEIDLPEAILTSPSLKSLVLKHGEYFDCYEKFPNVYLPSLKNLELDGCVDPSKLLSGSPVLENLMLIVPNKDYGCYVYIPTIQMPRTLKRLIFEDNSTEDNNISHRVIDTPSLEYLYMKIIAKSKLQVSFSDFPNMVEAHLHIHHGRVEHVLWVPKLLVALRETKLLALKHCATECLFNGVTFEFPEFPRLLNLELDVACFNTDFLLNFLHNCHVLEDLVVHVLKSVVYCELYFHRSQFYVPAPPTMVSNCVTSHLKSFEFREYENSADEREFIEYLLQRGLVLKRVTIHLYY
ncbi:F-box/LRR-repeat protein At3g59200-like [Arachis duranensis]|nr:F-box/LRR-repeat protein At3g59200-like [Arachis duranensis]